MTASRRPRRPPQQPQPRGAPVVSRVLGVTLEHLARHGYATLSVPDVAAEANVHKTSVYRRWPTKAMLVQEALAGAMGHQALPPDTGRLRDDMLHVARAALVFVESPLGMGVLRTLLAEGGNPEVRDLAATVLASQESDAPRLVVMRAIARGELPPDVNAEMLFRAIAGTLLHRIFIEQAPVRDDFLEQLVDLVLRGVLAPTMR